LKKQFRENFFRRLRSRVPSEVWQQDLQDRSELFQFATARDGGVAQVAGEECVDRKKTEMPREMMKINLE
jgi:hypothetical protein